jgi:hypothetical protein
MPHGPLSAFNLDLVRASLGPDLATPYAAAFGAVPWLTTGTLEWAAADAEPVLGAWLRWAPERTLTAVRLGVADELPRAIAAADQVARGLDDTVEQLTM